MPLPGRAMPLPDPALPVPPLAPAPLDPALPAPPPPPNSEVSDDKPAFLLNWTWLTSALALTVGLPCARAITSCNRASRMRAAAS